MNWRRSLPLAAVVMVIVPHAVRAQRALEVQVQAVTALAHQRFVGGGFGVALRTNGRMRLGAYLNGGDYGGVRAARPELTAFFHLNPFKRTGVSLYAGGGIALIITGSETREYLMGALGLEWKPGSGRGWFLEAGFGGGVRLAAGYQLRRRHRRR